MRIGPVSSHIIRHSSFSIERRDQWRTHFGLVTDWNGEQSILPEPDKSIGHRLYDVAKLCTVTVRLTESRLYGIILFLMVFSFRFIVQGSTIRRALGCEKFQPGPAWVVLSIITGPPFSGALYFRLKG